MGVKTTMNLFSIFTQLGMKESAKPTFFELYTNFSARLSEILNEIVKTIQSFPLDGFMDAICMMKLYKIGYPPCVHLNQEERELIDKLIKIESNDSEICTEIIADVEKIIFLSYNENKIKSIFEYWKKCVYLNKDRLPALEEAMDAYNNHNYYSCVAIVMCQIEGVINENEKYLKNRFEAFSECSIQERYAELVDGQCEEFCERTKEDAKKFNKNVPKLRGERQILLSFNYITLYFSEYLTKYLYGNFNEKDKRMFNHPNRNKICHGVDIGFGTREKALKSILCIDALIWILSLQEFEEVTINGQQTDNVT